ncbi:hypothetical protein OH77DRAFT_803663 [Trametes cingulata]|nr:hypothetical protein OH77DRAFT_803663 [Trametes cingulata]
MADYKFRDIVPRSVPPVAPQPDPLRATLSRLGLTEEQFKAKQTEMMEVLLRNQPFVPKGPPQQAKAPAKLSTDFYERVLGLSGQHSRGRSGSVSSSSSSRDTSPVPRTPARKDHGDSAPPRPRDQMELIIEQRNRAKEGRRRASTSRQREETRVNSTPTHPPTRQAAPNVSLTRLLFARYSPDPIPPSCLPRRHITTGTTVSV